MLVDYFHSKVDLKILEETNMTFQLEPIHHHLLDQERICTVNSIQKSSHKSLMNKMHHISKIKISFYSECFNDENILGLHHLHKLKYFIASFLNLGMHQTNQSSWIILKTQAEELNIIQGLGTNEIIDTIFNNDSIIK